MSNKLPHQIAFESDTIKGAMPCPFCGGEPEGCTSAHFWWVRCADCGTEAEGSRTALEAVRLWNRRVPIDIPQREVTEEEMREAGYMP